MTAPVSGNNIIALQAMCDLRFIFMQVLLKAVKKTYWPRGLLGPPVRAVRDISLSVREGECYGLLGVNGAGKTTTFKMITGEEAPDRSSSRQSIKPDVLLAGESVLSSRSSALGHLGFCPQFDGLPPTLSGVEILTFFAR